MIITTNHSKDVLRSERVWVTVMGPNTPPGLQPAVQVTQRQVAATITVLMGPNFQQAFPEAA